MRYLQLSVFALLAGTATAGPPPLNSPTAYIASVDSRERTHGGDRLRPAWMAGAISVIDIDHDGVPDYLVDYEQVIHGSWCGTGGCSFELWRGVRGGHPVPVWNEMVRQRSVVQRGGRTVFDFDFHGGQCGTYGAAACPASFVWDPVAGRLVEAPTAQGVTIDRMIEPLAIRASQVPATIMADIKGAQAQCAALKESFVVRDNLPVSIPDIDGDGVRDWALVLLTCAKDGAGDMTQTLYATMGKPAAPVKVTDPGWYQIDFATAPAGVSRINKTDACEIYSIDADVKICDRTALVWDGGRRRLKVK